MTAPKTPPRRKTKKTPTQRPAKKSAKKPTQRSARKSGGRARVVAPASKRLAAILTALRRLYPEVTTALDHRDAYQLLVATILSAQCTDERVNQVTPALFSRYPDPPQLAAADISELEKMIRPTGFFRNKAKSLLGAARQITTRHGGQVPRTMEGLTSLPGVARKTANVVLGTVWSIAAGVVVDTHVKRVSSRLGFTRQSDPKKIEQDLMALLPQEEWIDFSHRLIWHGRRVCNARKPLCEQCALAPHCPSAAV